MAEDLNFDIVMRGYDREQVDKTMDELRTEIEHLSEYNETAARFWPNRNWALVLD